MAAKQAGVAVAIRRLAIPGDTAARVARLNVPGVKRSHDTQTVPNKADIGLVDPTVAKHARVRSSRFLLLRAFGTHPNGHGALPREVTVATPVGATG